MTHTHALPRDFTLPGVQGQWEESENRPDMRRGSLLLGFDRLPGDELAQEVCRLVCPDIPPQANMRTALHEALMNALLHGNLELASEFDTLDSLGAYYERAGERLAKLPYARRTLTVEYSASPNLASITITDQGNGYDAQNLHSNPTHPHGRGLSVISQCASTLQLREAGRQIVLHFDLRPLEPSATPPPLSPGIAEAPILIVDDVMFNCIALQQMLRARGFTSTTIATGGAEALEHIKTITPQLIVLDLEMPEMDGFEVCRRLRASPATASIPILVQTALEDYGARVKAFSCGATDLITKPVHSQELIARCCVHLEKQRLFSELQSYRQAMHQQLHQASEMQLALLPSEKTMQALEQDYGLRLRAHFQPSEFIGGDGWGIQRLSPDKIAIYMADFSGHGVAAALHTFRLHGLMQNCATIKDYRQFIQDVHQTLGVSLPPGQYATMFFGVLDTRREQLSYVPCACPHPVLVVNGQARLIDGTGFPLGSVAQASFQLRTIAFPRGSMLFLYSDALTETRDEKGNFLSEKALLSLLAASAAQGGVEAAHQQIMLHFNQHFQAQVQDDLTWLALELCKI